MKLRDIYFPPVLGASGVQGFFGNPNYKEYHHSSLIKMFYGNIFKNMGFVAKTATALPNKGNVELNKDGFSFKKFLPNAIYPMIFDGSALNAIGLSNSGFEFLLKLGIWQQRIEPFMLSFMPITSTKEGRIEETKQFVEIMQRYMHGFSTNIALQINLSCPNTGEDQQTLIEEAFILLGILAELNIPLVPKINALLDQKVALDILNNQYCDALCVSNTIPFGALPKKIDWRKYKQINGQSPLQKYGYPAGGLSGAPIFPVVMEWLAHFCSLKGNTKPIIAGGGVMSENNVRTLLAFPNVKSISIGSVAFLRPWKVKSIVRACYAK